MGRDEDLPSVDFVVGEPFRTPTGGPERGIPGGARLVFRDALELPDGVDTAPPSGPRWGRRLFAAGVLAAAVVAAAVHGRGQHVATGAPTNTPTNAPTSSAADGHLAATPARVPSVIPQITTSLIETTRGVRNIAVAELPITPTMPACPRVKTGQSACVTVHAVPAAFTAAVGARFPQTRQLSATSVQLRNSGAQSQSQSRPGVLWSRSYTGRTGRVTIVVTVEDLKLDEASRGGVSDDGSHTVVFSERTIGGHLVVVKATAPSGHSPWLGEVNALARDPRLVAN